MRQKEQTWVMVLRILLAIVFLFSGFTKAIDPIGFSITISDMLSSFGMGFLNPLSLLCAFVMIVLEFTLGFTLLLRIKVNLTAIGYLAFMTFFFFLTLWLAVAEYLEIHHGYNFGVVKDCGCFGSVIKPNNMETFLKNVVIMIPTLIIFFKRKSIPDIKMTELGKWTFAGMGALLIFVLEVYCYRNLPIMDFSDWKKGDDVSSAFIEQPAQKDIVFVYQNIEDQSEKTLTQDELMNITESIPDFYDQYEYVDRKDVIIEPAVHPEIAGFNMLDVSGADHASVLISSNNENPVFLLFMADLDKVNMKGVKNQDLQNLVDEAAANGASFVAVTNSPQEEIEKFIEENNINFPIYQNPIDPVKGPFMVRDAVRSNPGLILIHKGNVVDKWAWRNFPKYSDLGNFAN